MFGVVGLLLTGLGTVAYLSMQPGPETPAPQRQRIAILVAAGPLRAGSLLQPADLGSAEVDEATEVAGVHRDSADERRSLTGGMIRRTLGQNDPIMNDDVLRPGDRGFLAAVLAPGTRAVSVAVDAVSGAAGLIWPGDRVDVILTQTIDQPEQGLGHRVAGETVLADARVIAVDQQLVQGGQASGLLDQHGAPSSRTITLEVDPRDAARIAVATRLGKLQVVLRAAQPEISAASGTDPARPARSDATTPIRAPAAAMSPPIQLAARAPAAASTPGVGAFAPVWGGDVSQALGDDGVPPRNAQVRVYAGTRRVDAYKF